MQKKASSAGKGVYFQKKKTTIVGKPESLKNI